MLAWGHGNREDLEIGLGTPEPSQWCLGQSFNDKHFGDQLDHEDQDEDGDDLDTKEVSDLELNDKPDVAGESDCDGMGSATVDDEPSLGSLDRRMNQTKWSRPDYTPKGVWGITTDAEFDEADLCEGDGDCDREYDDTGISDADGLMEQCGSNFNGAHVE